MRRFLGKLLVFAVVQLFIVLALWLHDPGAHMQFEAATIDKHRHADSITGPRVFFVGGSNVALGVDSPKIHAAMEYTPVNLALNSMVGLDFMLNEASDVARAGDVVVLSLEFEHFWRDLTAENALLVVEARPESIKYISPSATKTILDQALVAVRNIIRRAIRGRARPQNSRSSFNEYGDFVGHHGQPSVYRGEPDGVRSVPDDTRFVREVIDKLNNFQRDCRRRGICVVFSSPPLSESGFRRQGPRVGYVVKALDDDLEFPIVNSASELILPDHLFYDSQYHLTLDGKQERSRRVISALHEYLASEEHAEYSMARR